MILNSGAGKNYSAEVDVTNKLAVRSITESESVESTDLGNAYNINTGTIGLTSSTESAILYYKHNEDQPIIIEALAVGIGSAGTVTDSSVITLIKNPTTGTIISGASAVDMNENRNFSSSNTLLNSLAYKGAEGNTFTDGDDVGIFYQSAGGRLFASINFELRKGNSIGVKIDTNTSSGTTNVYAALVAFLKTN